MYTIGFTTEFYTLWWVDSQAGMNVQANDYFVKNLSKDLESAKAKMKGVEGKDWVIDLELKGVNNWEFSGYKPQQELVWADWQFPFGKLVGEDIRTSEDAWQIRRVYEGGVNMGGRRQVIARRRLVELGELVRYDMEKTENLLAPYSELLEGWNWGDKGATVVDKTIVYGTQIVRTKYATPKQIEWYEKDLVKVSLVNGHHGTDNTREVLFLKQVDSFSFEGYYGRTYIVSLTDQDNRLFKYMGSNPPDISSTEFNKFKATIAHSEYNLQPETKLKRIQKA